MADYHVMFNTDNNYLFYLFVTCQTLVDFLEQTSEDGQDHIVIHVLVDNEIDMPRAETYVQSFLKFNAQMLVKLSFEFHNVDAATFAGCNTMERNKEQSFTTYYRLLLARVLPEYVHRLLYLDIDLLVKQDIRKLFQQHPVNDSLFYAAPEVLYLSVAADPYDPDACVEIHAKEPNGKSCFMRTDNCIQAGVLLINVDQWRAQQVEQQCLELSKHWLLSFHDQDLLSMVSKGKVSHLSWEWNVTAPIFWDRNLDEDFVQFSYQQLQSAPILYHPTLEQVRKMVFEQGIIHFVGEFKPWSLTKRLTLEEAQRYKSTLPFAQAWLQAYARLAQAFKA